MNQIKSSEQILSPFHVVAFIHPKIHKEVNEGFILPKIRSKFGENFNEMEELATEKLITEADFRKMGNFVNDYFYKELMNNISKKDGKIIFKPKYVLTFDKNLEDKKICLGEKPILYYVYIDFQELMDYISILNKN